MSVETSEKSIFKSEKILSLIVKYLTKKEKLQILTLNKLWSKCLVTSLYHEIVIDTTKQFEAFLKLINSAANETYYPYLQFIKSLELSGTADIWMGDIEAALKPLNLLETFTITNSPNVTNILLHSLGTYCSQLKKLYLPGCVGITDAFVPQLCKSCQDLECVDLSFTNVSVGIIPAALIQLKNIKELDLGDSKELSSPVDMGDEAFTRPLITLNLRNSPITDQMLAWVIARCPSIENIMLENCQNITDLSVTRLAKNLPNLKILDISFCDQITDNSLNALAENQNSKLNSLDVSYCFNITTRGIKQVGAKCTCLESLVLNGCENILSTCQQYCVGDECIIEGEFIKRMVDELEASNPDEAAAMKPKPSPEDLIVPIKKIPREPTEAELHSQSKEKRSINAIKTEDGTNATEDVTAATTTETQSTAGEAVLTKCRLKTRRSMTALSRGSKGSYGSHHSRLSSGLDDELEGRASQAGEDDDDDSLPSLNSQVNQLDLNTVATNNTTTTPSIRKGNNYKKKGPRSENSFSRNSNGNYRKNSKRNSYYENNSYDNRSRHSEALNDITNKTNGKPRRRPSFNSQYSNSYDSNNNGNNGRYRPRSYNNKIDNNTKKINRYSNSHYSNHSNRFSNNQNENNYPNNDNYTKVNNKGELLGKIKFMLKDGPKYISIHENDDPQDLGYNFCKYHNMMDIMEGVVKTIAIKKNAMRKKKIDISI